MGGQILGEGVAEQGQGGGGKRAWAKGVGQGGWDKGGKGGGIYILMKFSTKQLEH